MAKVSQSQNSGRWNPYNIGEMRKVLKEELEKLSTNDSYRNSKVGTAHFKEAKGRTNWNIYLYGELFERFTKRFDDTMRGTYTNTLQIINTQTATLNNISQQIRTLELNVNKFLKSNFENVVTNVVRNAGQLDDFKKEYLATNDELLKLTEANKSDIRKATKILKDSFVTELSSFKDEISGTTGDLKEKLTGLNEDFKTEMKNFNSSSTEFVDSVKTTMGDANKSLDEKLDEIKISVTEDLDGKLDLVKEGNIHLTSEITGTKSEVIELINDKITKHQETMNNVLEDQQKLTVTELQEILNAGSKQSTEDLENHAVKIAQRVDETGSSLEAKINEMTEAFNQKLTEFREDYDKNFEREMGELRSSINTIRADIEIMKTLLASMAK
jgi:hypothetical protein